MDVTDASLQPTLILLAAAVLAVLACRFLAPSPRSACCGAEKKKAGV